MPKDKDLKEKKVEEKLSKMAEEGVTDRAKKDLLENIEDYRRLIFKMARKYVRNRVEHDDLVQEAMIGLILADRDFDSTRSSDFHTYAIYRMKGKMYEYCIGNETPIYVPTHVAKAASYVKQMQRLLEKEPSVTEERLPTADIISVEKHEIEETFNAAFNETLRELKRKLGRIAINSKMSYEKLAGLALKSLSLMVSDEVLSKFPKENELVDELVSNRELSEMLRESLGEKKFTVLSMRLMGHTYQEIAYKLESIGHTNKEGKAISRQAVKAILDDTLEALGRSRLLKQLNE